MQSQSNNLGISIEQFARMMIQGSEEMPPFLCFSATLYMYPIVESFRCLKYTTVTPIAAIHDPTMMVHCMAGVWSENTSST